MDHTRRRCLIAPCALLGGGLCAGSAQAAGAGELPAPATANTMTPAVVAGGAPALALPALENLVLHYAGYLVTGAGAAPIASARLSVSVADQRYRISLSVDSFLADLVYSSEGRVDASGLHPELYSEARKIPFRSRRVRSVRLRETDDPARAGHAADDVLWVPPGTQDRVSLLFQYTLLARADRDVLRAGAERSIPFARVSDVTPSRWVAGPAERVRALDADEPFEGPFAHRVARVADAQATVDVAFWLWAGERHLPLILQFTEKERSLRFVATAIA
ncbi:MAG: DUF3108 domain-containing protein [Burkholderiaceae bacterium]